MMMLTVVWNHTDFTSVMSSQRAGNVALGIISLTAYRPYPKFLLVIKMNQENVL
jgi:hypothetical protein